MNNIVVFVSIVGIAMTVLLLVIGLIDALVTSDDKRRRAVSYRSLEQINRTHPHGE